jgi:hypothetical protein
LVCAFTGELALVMDVVLKLLFYYGHERGWESSALGQMKHPLASLPVKRPLRPRDRQIIEPSLEELGYL